MSHTYTGSLTADCSRVACAREALLMVDFQTQKLWMKFVLSLCLVVFVIQYDAEAAYIGFMITLMWTEIGEFARAYRDVKQSRSN